MTQQEQIFSDNDLKFKLPFGMILAGPSSSGKSTFLMRFIAESDMLITPKPASVLYCFGEMSDLLSISEAYLSSLFTAKSHHQNFAIVFVTQNLFDKKVKVAR